MKRISFWRGVVIALVIFSILIFISSCSEENGWLADEIDYKSLTVDGVLYYGPETFTKPSKDPLIITQIISAPNFKYLENFLLKVRCGTGKSKATSIEISIDGVLLVTSADFKKKVNPVQKDIIGLTEQSILEVRINGNKPGAIIELLIEGSLQEDVITDVDGNYYHTVQIGDQLWMAENLRTSRYVDLVPIPNVTDDAEWASLCYVVDDQTVANGAFCWYNNDPTYDNSYGKLYNWGTVETGKLCPTGWHVPTFSEFRALVMPFVEANTYALDDPFAHGGYELMETPIGSNETGFSAKPVGNRQPTGVFGSILPFCFYWVSDGWWFPGLKYYYKIPHDLFWPSSPSACSISTGTGLPIRCVKD